MVINIVFARPMRSPSTPKKNPPRAQPIMKIVVAMPPYQSTEASSRGSPGCAPSRLRTAEILARLKSCWSIVSKSQPSDATVKTNHW